MRRHERTPTRFIYVQGPASVLGRFLAYANELKADPYWEEWTSFCPKKGSGRGVTCRAMADDLGSRTIIRSEHWQAMRAAGVRVAAGLPIGNPLLRPFKGRIDLRNHRKIVVIDDRITYCGSQNCADPEFRVKAKYAPWVDAVMRFEGPIARQNQFLFASDWMTFVQENLDDLLSKPLPLPMSGGALAQVTGTGPTVRYPAM